MLYIDRLKPTTLNLQIIKFPLPMTVGPIIEVILRTNFKYCHINRLPCHFQPWRNSCNPAALPLATFNNRNCMTCTVKAHIWWYHQVVYLKSQAREQ